MIRHIVTFRFSEEADGHTKAQNIDRAQEIANHFLAEIPSLASFQFVRNLPGTPENNDDFALICEFADLAALYAYKEHPRHVTFGAFTRLVRESRSCIDYEV